ncbi:MAG: DUF4270 family protein [Bacteroidota bacterium]
MTRSYHSPKSITRSLNFLSTLFLASAAGILFLFNSCEDEGTIIGKNILPAGDFVSLHSTDTLSVYSYTMFTDSLESDNPADVFLGQIQDPYFGTTTAGFVTQLRLSNQLDEAAWTIDSVQLTLTFENVTGDIRAGHILKLSEISEQIFPDSTYYSNQAVPLTGFSMEVTLPQLQADTVNNLILTLPVALGEYIIRDTSMLFHSDDEPDFRSYLRGLYFELEASVSPVFITMNIEAPGDYETYKHQLYIYMHDADGTSDILLLNIDAQAKNAAFSTFNHDLSTADPFLKITHVNDRIKDTLSYVQCLNGIYTKLEIPGLEQIRNDSSLDGILINKARLTCPVHFDGSSYNGASFPSQLFMGYYDKLDRRYLIPDYYVSTAFFDGVIDTTAANYTFNIARYIQRYLDDTTEYYKPEFQLALPAGSLRNAILKANGSANPVKFELVYTRF